MSEYMWVGVIGLINLVTSLIYEIINRDSEVFYLQLLY